MRKSNAWIILLLLAGCSKSANMTATPQAEPAMYDVAAPAALAVADVAQPTNATPTALTPAPLKVAIPQMAYKYGHLFRLPEAAISAAQSRHMALCDQLGPARCQLLNMTSAGGEGNASATLKLRVASNIARAFGARLSDSIAKAGGRTVTATIAAEDVSKDIVDTEARLSQRELLVARLTEILRTRQGKVAELVEAERSVAAAQEEIDQAKGWLTELRSRVAMSTVDIGYEPVAPGPAAARGGLLDSVTQSGSVFVAGLSAILQVTIFLLPWVLLALAGWFVGRRWLSRWPRRDVTEDAPPA